MADQAPATLPHFPSWVSHRREIEDVVRIEHRVIRHVIEESETHLTATLYFYDSLSNSHARLKPSKSWARFRIRKGSAVGRFVGGRTGGLDYANVSALLAHLPIA